MKDLVFTLVLFLCCAAFIGHLEINFSPFAIRLPMWHRVVAVLLFAVSIAFWTIGERIDAYSKGLKTGLDTTFEQIKEGLKNEK